MSISKLIKCKIPLFYLDLKHIVNRGFMKFTGTSFREFHENHFFQKCMANDPVNTKIQLQIALY